MVGELVAAELRIFFFTEVMQIAAGPRGGRACRVQPSSKSSVGEKEMLFEYASGLCNEISKI